MTFLLKQGPFFMVLCIIIFSTGNISGQIINTDLTFNNWQKKDGLPSNSVSAVVKDHLGFIWMATNDGLCRFDGPNLIKVYRKSSEESGSTVKLHSDNIRSLICDSKGILWIGTVSGGLTKFNIVTNEWTTYRHNKDDITSISNDDVLTILEDSNHRLWVGTERGLNIFNQDRETFTRLPLTEKTKNSKNYKSILKVVKDQNGWIWVGTWAEGLYLFLEDSAENELKFRRILLDSDKAANNVWTIYQDMDGRYWVGTHGGGLFLMNLPKDASNLARQQDWEPSAQKYFIDDVHAPNLFSNAIQDLKQDKFGNLWVGTAHGLYRIREEFLLELNKKEQTIIQFDCFLKSSKSLNSIIGNTINDLMEDDQGMLWIATSDGLSQFNWYSNQFKNFYFPDDKDHLAYAPNLYIDKTNKIWVGSWKSGIIQYRLEENKLVQINEKKAIDIIGNRVSSIHSPDDEWLYVGTELGITAVNLKTLATKKYPTPDWVRQSIQDLFVVSIMVDKKGYIWVGTKVGLFIINPDTKIYHFHEPSRENPESLSDNAITNILIDSKDNIWIATYNGLNRVKKFTEDKVEFEHFFFNEQNPELGPVDNSILVLKECNEKLYLGTTSGFCGYNYTTKKFEAYNNEQQKYQTHAISKTKEGDIWLSTNEGLFYFDSKKQIFNSYDSKDGITEINFRLGSSFTDEENNIYFAFNNGFTYFNHDVLTSNKVPPPVYITNIEKMNRNGLYIEEGINTKELTLNYEDYRVSFDVATLNYNRADKNQFAYRLKGFEEQWNEGELGIPIVYTNLKPKDYTLEVKAANNNGIWNENITSLQIVQCPAYWETWWFSLCIIGCTGAIVFCIFRWYTNKIRRHNQILQAYNQKLSSEITQRKNAEQQLNEYNEELKRSNRDLEQFAYIASHDLKEPLRMVGNFSGLLAHKYKANLDEDAFEYIGFIEDGVTRMSNLINSLLTYSRVGRKESAYESIQLNSFLKTKFLDLSQFIKEKNAIVEIGDLSAIYGEKEQIGMVFFNLVHNALKFNKSKNPMVSIQQEKDSEEGFWKFSVKDNGIGIDSRYAEKVFGIFKRLHNKRDYEGTGIGLSLCQKIIFRHQGTIWIESELGEGTTFFFTIKKNLEQFDNSSNNSASENQVEPINLGINLGINLDTKVKEPINI